MKYTRGIIGVDEVGRGAWAGPFVACAVAVGKADRVLKGVKDSKEYLELKRNKIADELTCRHFWGLGVVTVEELNEIGLARAQILVFERAVGALSCHPGQVQDPIHRIPDKAGMTNRIIIDGRRIKSHPEWEAVVDGDAKIYAIAAASVIAKVARDQMMRDLHVIDNRYGFDQHKGYGTALHDKMLKMHGVSPHHRRSFMPMRKMV